MHAFFIITIQGSLARLGAESPDTGMFSSDPGMFSQHTGAFPPNSAGDPVKALPPSLQADCCPEGNFHHLSK